MYVQSCQPCATKKRNHDGKKKEFLAKKRNALKRNLQPRATYFQVPYGRGPAQGDALWCNLSLILDPFEAYFMTNISENISYNF